MRLRTYSPLPGWVPSAFCAAILFAAHVVGPLVARLLTTLPNTLAELPHEGDTP